MSFGSVLQSHLKDGINLFEEKEDLSTTLTPIHTLPKASYFSDTGSDMVSVFEILLRVSELLEEDNEKLDD